MKHLVGASLGAIALICASPSSAAIVWQGQAQLWDADLNTAGISLDAYYLGSFKAGTTYQVRLYGDGKPISGGLQVWQFFAYNYDHYDDPDWEDANEGDWVDFHEIGYSPSIRQVSNGFIAYASVPKDIAIQYPDGYYTQWHWALPTVEVFFDGSAIGKTFTIDISAVPEPATWAMMIVGFGMAGTAIRRRRTLRAV